MMNRAISQNRPLSRKQVLVLKKELLIAHTALERDKLARTICTFRSRINHFNFIGGLAGASSRLIQKSPLIFSIPAQLLLFRKTKLFGSPFIRSAFKWGVAATGIVFIKKLFLPEK